MAQVSQLGERAGKCIAQGCLGLLESLVGEGFRVNDYARYDRTALQLAVESGQEAICRFLIEHGADVRYQRQLASGGHYLSALHLAAGEGMDAIAALLVNAGAVVSARAAHNLTPLHLALERMAFDSKCTTISKLLIAHGADTNAIAAQLYPTSRVPVSARAREPRLWQRDLSRSSCIAPLHIAIHSSMVIGAHDRQAEWADIVHMLLAHGADPDFVPPGPPPTYLTPFQLAVKVGAVATIEIFLKSGKVDLNKRTVTGRTLRQVAGKRHDIMQMLLSTKTADVVQEGIGEPDSIAAKPVGRPNGLAPL
jgi:ankyrin repeat protein